KIAKLHVDPAIGLMDYQIRQLAYRAGFAPAAMRGAGAFLRALYKVYTELDCSLAEINPLVVTKDGQLIAADAKMNVDDNALYRQKELAAMREVAEENPIEVEARRRGLAYVHLDGDIGIVGNGAGLVMTTLDVVQRAGGRPANFLDVGGGANAEVVRNALEVVLMNPHVKAVLFNIFGGITRCDEVAKGIVEATATVDINVPIVIRLVGTREEEGRQVLAQASGKVQLIPAATMQEAAEKVVALVN
ncbi:MAG: succinate--CoA ligase subunit beta, partial [Abditibacteriales bacterium]|nr:succinate--CoA ligase subunit beta [Abditibacteriales bacterium]MDW8366408.1 ATP-grasp domain-containing protein [Abditibacteriales bacterium]